MRANVSVLLRYAWVSELFIYLLFCDRKLQPTVMTIQHDQNNRLISVSRSCSIDDRIINICGAVGGMIFGRENRSTRRKLAPVSLVSHMFRYRYRIPCLLTSLNNTECDGDINTVARSELLTFSLYWDDGALTRGVNIVAAGIVKVKIKVKLSCV
jgi:hypothetical protein